MKTKVKMSLASIVLSIAMVIGAMAVPFANTEKVQAAEVVDMGIWYVAKGQPKVFQDKKAKNIKVISAAGNKYKVSKNKLTIICKKSGKIKYKANGKNKQFYLIVGGNGKDPKVKKSEYKMISQTVNKKKYTNFIDGAAAYMGKKGVFCCIENTKKKEVNAASKYNRGVKYGTSFKTLKKKYPSWQDVGFYGNDDCCYAALYYDKKTGIVAQKGFILDKNYKVKGVVQLAYKVKSKADLAKLESYYSTTDSSEESDSTDDKNTTEDDNTVDDKNTSNDKNNSEDDSKKEDTNTSDEIKREDARFYLNLANPIILDGNKNVYFLSCADCKYIDGKYKVDTVYMIGGGDPFFEKGLKTTEEFDKHYNVTEGEGLKESMLTT